MDERFRALMGGELIKLRDQYFGSPLSTDDTKAVSSFVDFCVAHLNSGSELGLMVHEHTKTADRFGK